MLHSNSNTYCLQHAGLAINDLALAKSAMVRICNIRMVLDFFQCCVQVLNYRLRHVSAKCTQMYVSWCMYVMLMMCMPCNVHCIKYVDMPAVMARATISTTWKVSRVTYTQRTHKHKLPTQHIHTCIHTCIHPACARTLDDKASYCT